MVTQGQWGTGVYGSWAMEHMGNASTGGNGVWGSWVMWHIGNAGTGCNGLQGPVGYRGYWAHGQWGTGV